ncbi:hypothetical protein NP493_1444g02012 [Ridgeia piscesae]|uniref:DZIP3-like HEPN domain-containing protein n=1 Tax=Ridgeia piscesae TaxID=27915 RepID=A0AAD9NB66_RIDPI|nr:hypothetical protein NP493_1444g02012 [Ridgeia piscesae]
MSGASLTDDQERFLRIVHILLDDVPNHLRAMLKAKFQARFGFAWGDNRATGEFFFANFTARNTPPHIANVIRQGKTEAFDSTALVTCLLFSGTGILLPTPRRVPRPHPFTESERIDELREMRNELAHASSASLTQADFNQKLASLNTIYAQLLWNPTVMRQWAQDPVVTAESDRNVQRLEGSVEVLDQAMQGTDRRVQALDELGQVLYENHEQRLKTQADVQEQQAHSICQLQEDVNRHGEAITQLTQQ